MWGDLGSKSGQEGGIQPSSHKRPVTEFVIKILKCGPELIAYIWSQLSEEQRSMQG